MQITTPSFATGLFEQNSFVICLNILNPIGQLTQILQFQLNRIAAHGWN
jgi:hypothetical protein